MNRATRRAADRAAPRPQGRFPGAAQVKVTADGMVRVVLPGQLGQLVLPPADVDPFIELLRAAKDAAHTKRGGVPWG